MATGRDRIAVLAGREGAPANRDREWGYHAELAQAGRAVHARAVGHFDLDRAAQATRDLFAGPERPDALVVLNDHMAFRALAVLRHERGLSVPGDVAVLGFADVPGAAAPEYDLSTLHQPLDRMAAHAVRILLAESEGAAPEQVSLAPRLVARGSTEVGRLTARGPDG